MYKNLIVFGALGLVCAAFSGQALAAEKTCTNGNVSVLANGDHCFTEPTYYGITVYEMGLCKGAPTPPTITTVADTAACEVVFSSAAGALVEVQNGTTSEPAGTFTRPANGTYTHAYMRLNNTFLIKGSVDFGAAHATITNRYCVASTATTDNETGANGTCSAVAGATSGLTSTELTDFSGGNQSNTTTYTVGSLTAYLLDNIQNLADGTGGAETTQAGAGGILGIQQFPSAITITDETTTMDAAITVSKGMTVSVNGVNTVGFDSGPFVLVLSVQ